MENLAGLLHLMINAFLAIWIASLLGEGHAELGEQGIGFLVGLGRGDDDDVETLGPVDLVVLDFGKIICSLTPVE